MPLREALSAIGEFFVSKLFDYSLDKLCSSEFLQFATEKQIQEELENLKKELMKIRVLLDDAEERQLKDQYVKLWLSELQNLAYDVDDIVDELQTEISMRNLMLERRGSSSKKPRLIPDSVKVVMSNSGMMSKIKYITAKLKDLEPQKNQLQLRMNRCQKSNRIKERQQPTSVEIETHVYGRDEDKEAILKLVFKSDDEANFVIPIVGMGGIGKTTLAQLVYNDPTIQNHFDLKAWVCVSDDFDVTRITKAILQALTPWPCNDNDLNSLQENLKKLLSRKKFLIVLDDVWNEDYHSWTILQSPFLTRTPGSKIIVTTRNSSVSSTMGASHAHSLKVLSEDDCLSVFAQHALGARDFGGHPNLKEVAEKIATKCNGLPLAAKTLGGLLRTNVDHDAWKDILDSEIWKLSEEHQCAIIPALQLSYHHLPPDLKRCFAYCSNIPKDYEFEVKEIILLWRAQGFLQEARDKHSIEDLGHKYFKDLVSRSLLQISNKDGSRFVMHDLINDLALSVTGEICFRIDSDQQILKGQISNRARHLSYVGGRFDGIKKFQGINEAPHLRTFLPLRLYDHRGFLSNAVLTDLLPNLRCLRALSLSWYEIEELPDIFGDLKHLRYLNFSHTSIKCLPESISKLYNLETLLLRGCSSLKKLPSGMDNLINLCYLDISGEYELEDFPSNLGTLSDLQILSLSNFVLHVGKGCHIRELGGLSNLKGQLCISGLENVVEIQDAGKAKLVDMSGLNKLELKWSENIENRKVEMEKKVLDSLQPSKNLKELALKYYCGERLGEWIGHFSFGKLLSLCLEHCPNCISLPSIGQLPLLKKVSIKGLRSVTRVGVDFFGKKLEILEFEDMFNWENWSVYEVDEEARKFPSLRELCIKKCPKLLGSMPEYLPLLEKLVISECEKLVIQIQSFPMLSELEIEGCQKVVLGSLKAFANDRSLKKVSFSKIPKFTCAGESLTLESVKVEYLNVKDCEELCSLLENNWRLLTQSMSIDKLRISNCSQVVSVGAEEEREELMHLKIPCSIQQLTIRDFERLEKLSTTFHYFTLLTELALYNCPSLISLSKNNLPLNLKILEIFYCENLQCLLEERENVDISNACLLERLQIHYCPSLISLSKNNLPLNLKILNISDCENLQCLLEERENVDISNASQLLMLDISFCPSLVSLSSRGELPTRLKYLEIGSCSKLEYIAQEFQDNSSLETICLSWCTNIKYLPQGLSKLSHLQCLDIQNCHGLQALPDGIHNLNSLEQLRIRDCSSVTSFPEEDVPTNLRRLYIEGPNICKAVIEWGLHRLTSLKLLSISNGFPYEKLFPQEEIGMVLPCSLTTLHIRGFPNLEILSSKGFQGLTSLEELFLEDCPKLKSLPEKDMLSSLLKLYIYGCPELKQRCKKVGGPEWSKIAHVPFLSFDSWRLHV